LEFSGEKFTQLFVRFLDAYSKEHNITMWGITVQNEPSLGRKFPGNGLYYEPEMERDFIKMNLGPTLHKSGYTSDKLKLMMYDDNVSMLDKWTDIILKDKEAAKYVSGIAFHWYYNSKTSEWPDILLDDIHNKYPNLFLLSSEACHVEGIGTGRWDFGEHYAHDIIRVSLIFTFFVMIKELRSRTYC
jgi:glucosylceramidase